MPQIKSDMKRVKVTEKKNMRNRVLKSSLKTTLKKFDSACADKNVGEAETLFVEATSAVDKAVTKGILHRNTANHKKAYLARHLDAAKAE